MTSSLKNKSILITGAQAHLEKVYWLLAKKIKPKKIVVFSRDELKQYELSKKYGEESIL